MIFKPLPNSKQLFVIVNFLDQQILKIKAPGREKILKAFDIKMQFTDLERRGASIPWHREKIWSWEVRRLGHRNAAPAGDSTHTDPGSDPGPAQALSSLGVSSPV